MPTDIANELFTQQIRQAKQSCLVVVDEATYDPAALATNHASFICNRIDLADAISTTGAPVHLNDYDFTGLEPGSFQTVIYRIGKEKAQVHHIINQAALVLAEGGSCILIGHKNEGFNTYVKKAEALFGSKASKNRGNAGFTVAVLTRTAQTGMQLDDQNYPEWRDGPAYGGCTFTSKPGLYGWNKIDAGSEYLVDYLPELAAQLPTNPTILDLGCGYGFITVMAHRVLGGSYVATDNNTAAVEACGINMQANAIPGTALSSDCGDRINQKFDAILCNPPFHKGFDTSGQLTDKFLHNSARLLKPGGIALYVVNEFIGLEKRHIRFFNAYQEVSRDKGFKLAILS